MPTERQTPPQFFGTASYQNSGQMAEIGRMFSRMRHTIQGAIVGKAHTAEKAESAEPSIHIIMEMMILAEATAEEIDLGIAALCLSGNHAEKRDDFALLQVISQQACYLSKCRNSLGSLERKLEFLLDTLPPILTKYKCRSGHRYTPFSQNAEADEHLYSFLRYVGSTVESIARATGRAAVEKDFAAVTELAEFGSILSTFQTEIASLKIEG